MTSQADIEDFLRDLRFGKVMFGYDPESVLSAIKTIDLLYDECREAELAQASAVLAHVEEELEAARKERADLTVELGALRERNEALSERNRLLEARLSQLPAKDGPRREGAHDGRGKSEGRRHVAWSILPRRKR